MGAFGNKLKVVRACVRVHGWVGARRPIERTKMKRERGEMNLTKDVKRGRF